MDKITLGCATKLIDHSIKKINADFDRPVSVAICDEHGDLIALCRMDGAAARSATIAQRKAYTAVRAGVSTNELFLRIQKENLELSYFCDSLFTAFPGGTLLKNNAGKVIGGIGISGLAANEDSVIAEYIAKLVSAEQV